MKRKELPLLAGIAGLIRWVEELVSLVSGPLLTLGLAIALIDLLTEGRLLTSLPLLLFGWAISQALGVDAQLVAAFDRAHIALRERRYWALFGLLVLGAMLCYVGWVAAVTFATQQSEGVSEASALARLGMDPRAWLVQRTALSVFLVALSGWQRYHAPAADVAAETEQERARLEADLALEPLRQQKRALQVRGARALVASALGKETPSTGEATPAPSSARTEASTPPSRRPPTGGGSPSQKPAPATGVITPAPNVTPLRPPARRKSVSTRRVARVSVEAKARKHYQPGMSASELARVARIGKSAASKYARLLSAEQAAL